MHLLTASRRQAPRLHTTVACCTRTRKEHQRSSVSRVACKKIREYRRAEEKATTDQEYTWKGSPFCLFATSFTRFSTSATHTLTDTLHSQPKPIGSIKLPRKRLRRNLQYWQQCCAQRHSLNVGLDVGNAELPHHWNQDTS